MKSDLVVSASPSTSARRLLVHRFLPLLAFGWLVLLTALYAAVAVRSLTHSTYLGTAQAWPTVAVIGVATLIGCLVGALNRPSVLALYCRVVVGGAALIVLTLLIASQSIVEVAVLLWVLLIGWSIGDRLLRLLFRREAGPVGHERIAFGIALSLGLFSHATLALALLNQIYRPLVVLLLVAATVGLWSDIRPRVRDLLQSLSRATTVPSDVSSWSTPALLALVGAWSVLVTVQVIAPEIQYDSLNYHLAVPRIFIDNQGFVTTPHIAQSWFSLGIQMDYLLFMLVGGQVAAKALNVVFVVLTCMVMMAFGQRFFSHEAGWLGAILYATMPLVAWEASTTYIDVALACYCLLAVVAAYRWFHDQNTAWAIVTGIFTGFALSAKLNALVFLVPLGFLIGIMVLFRRDYAMRSRLVGLVAYGAAALVVAAPWPALRYVQTGNPVFPFLNNIFKSPLWPQVNETFNFSTFGIGTSPGSLLRLPWEMSFSSVKFTEAMPDTMIGLGLLVLPLIVFGRPRSRPLQFLIVLLVLFGLGWAYTAQILRYFFPALPLAYLVAGYALARTGRVSDHLLKSSRGSFLIRALVIVWILCNVPLYLSAFWNIPERLPYKVALGYETREAYLTRVLSGYHALDYMERTYPGDDIHIMMVGAQEVRLYSSALVETVNSPLVSSLLSATEADEAIRLARERGISHIMVNRTGMPGHLASLTIIQEDFLEKYTTLEYARANVEIYRVLNEGEGNTRAVAAAPVELLKNSGFEADDKGVPAGWHAYGEPTIDRSGGQSRSGSGAVKVAAGSGYFQLVPVTSNRIYTLGHHARTDQPESAVRLQINWLDDQGKIIDVSIHVVNAGAEWKRNEFRVMAPPRAKTAAIYVNTQAGSAWFDDYSLSAHSAARD